MCVKKISLIMFMAVSITAYAQQAGYLDESFGDNGTVTTDFYNNFNQGNAVALHADGRIITAGYLWQGDDYDFIFARYLEDGSLDNSFSDDGMLRLDYPGSKDEINDVLVQPDDKIIAVGKTGNDTSSDYAIVRLNEDGTLDNTFSNDGMLIVDFDVWDEGGAVALQDDGKIIVVGFSNNAAYDNTDLTMCRLNVDGTLDNSFGSQGKVIYDVNWESADRMNDVVVYNGNIFVSGYIYNSDDTQGVAVVKFDENGNVVTSFGNDGVAYHELLVNYTFLWPGSKLSINQEGIYVSANEQWILDSDMAIVSFLHNGYPNDDFGDQGLVVVEMVVNSDAKCIALQNDGKILVGGTLYDDNKVMPNAFVARFLPDGTMDAGFGEYYGVEIVDINDADHEVFNSISLDYDNRIIAAGSVEVNNLDFFVARLYSGLELGVAENGEFSIDRLQVVNPVKNHLLQTIFKLKNDSDVKVNLYTIGGQWVGTVFNGTINEGESQENYKINPRLVSGLYLLKVTINDKERSYRVLIR